MVINSSKGTLTYKIETIRIGMYGLAASDRVKELALEDETRQKFKVVVYLRRMRQKKHPVRAMRMGKEWEEP